MPEEKSLENRAMAAAVRALRGGAKQTQAEFARNAGINYETFKRIVKGDRDINITQISGIARAGGVTPSELVAEAERWVVRLQKDEALSGVAFTTDDTDNRHEKQAEASKMTTEEIEDRDKYELAAENDPDERKDESGDDPDHDTSA